MASTWPIPIRNYQLENIKYFIGSTYLDWSSCEKYLTPDELSDCQKEQSLSLVRAHLRIATHQVLGSTKPISKLSNGRPYVDDQQQLSYSHSDEFFAGAVAEKNIEVGIDIQKKLLEKFNWKVYLGHFFNSEDHIAALYIENSLQISLEQAYLGLFSAKEAAFKALNATVRPINLKFNITKIESEWVNMCLFSDKGQLYLKGVIQYGKKDFVFSLFWQIKN